MTGWEDEMWTELEALPKAQQIVRAEEIIGTMSHRLLNELARHRRVTVVELIDGGSHNVSTLADTIGSRVSTIRRLLENGRAILKREKEAI